MSSGYSAGFGYGGPPVPSFDDNARGMPAGWHAGQFTTEPARSMMHGMDGPAYSREYNHATHLGDDVGVFRSNCPACQRHFREAFGPQIATLILRLGAVEPDQYREVVITWLADLEAGR